MLECSACVLRCLRAIAGDALKANPALRRQPLLLSTSLHPNRRRYASLAPAAASSPSQNGLVPGRQPVPETLPSADNPRESKNSLSAQEKRHLNLELRHLSDRVKLAEHVHYTLRKNEPEKALNLCRLASKADEVIVAWNHCIDWHLQRRRIEPALKIYNEMKKRAQFPDSYTYTILLRGLARGHHGGQEVKEGNVAKAVSIYNSLFSPTSRVKPSVIHTNAVLRVCSAAHDMDAMWGIAARMPSSGPGAPDHQTYTTLLNAIRFGAFGKNPEAFPPEQLTKRRDEAVQEGRRVWQDIIPKWRGGEVHIDEELVCAMGRLLLISRRLRDWDDVLNLVRQTMNLPRLLPDLDDPERNIAHIPRPADDNVDEDSLNPEPEPQEDSEGYTHAPSTLAFRPVGPLPRDSAHPHRPKVLPWARPGNATLSLLIEASTLLRAPKTATAYWDLLITAPFNLTPDLANFQSHLKLLAKNRASAKAAALLTQEMRTAEIEPKNQTFRLAMNACVRDRKNPNVLAHAGALVQEMQRVSPDPDIHTLIQYLNLALTTDDAAQVVAVLDRLDPIVHVLRSRVMYGADGGVEGEARREGSPGVHLREKTEVVEFWRTMVGAIDSLMNRGLVAREQFAHWHARRAMLTGFIGRAGKGVERLRGKLEGQGEDVEGAERVMRRRRGEVEGRKVPGMSRAAWALRTFRWNDRRKRVKEERMKAQEGVHDVESVEVFRGWRTRDKGGWRPGRVDDGGGRVDMGFADSPMELSTKG